MISDETDKRMKKMDRHYNHYTKASEKKSPIGEMVVEKAYITGTSNYILAIKRKNIDTDLD